MTRQKEKLQQEVEGNASLSPHRCAETQSPEPNKTNLPPPLLPPIPPDIQASLLCFGSLERRRGFERRGEDRDTGTGSMELRSKSKPYQSTKAEHILQQHWCLPSHFSTVSYYEQGKSQCCSGITVSFIPAELSETPEVLDKISYEGLQP